MAKRPSEKKSRAEQVRARRQQSQKKVQQAPSIGSSATRKQPTHRVPVTRRTPSSTVPVINRQRHNKVNVPLKSKGAEVQLPAFPKLKLGWRLISGAIFLLSLAVVITFSSLGTFSVNAITLEGAERLTSDIIMSQIGVSGTSIVKIAPKEIEARIAEIFPSVETVKVTAGLPASLTVKITERQPLILWQQEGNSLWIDDEGVMFVPRGEAEVPLAIIATGNPPAGLEPAPETDDEDESADTPAIPTVQTRTTPEFVQAALALQAYLPEGSSLQYSPDYGLGWQDPNGWLVYFGNDLANIDLKLVEYQTIIAELQAKNLTPALISLEFLYAPFIRLEP
jgi:cell division protein FtsQ